MTRIVRPCAAGCADGVPADGVWEQPEWLDDVPYDSPPTPTALVNPRIESLDLQHASHQGYDTPPNVMKAEAGEPCRVCGRGAGTAYLCRQCQEEWEVHLGNMPSLIEDLELAAQRRVRFGGREGNPSLGGSTYDPTDSDSVQPRHLHTRHPSHVSPPMPDLHAAEIIGELRNELVGQVRAMCETFDLEVPALGSDAAGMSRWLLSHADNIRWMDDADGLVRDLDHAMHRGVQAIDKPKQPAYVCACADCGLAVWADPGQPVVTCPCGRTYDVVATRGKRILTAHDYLVTLQEARTLSRVPLETIRTWVKRGQITVRGSRVVEVEVMSATGTATTRTREVQVVRYGDVVNLHEIDTARDLSVSS